jgi:hypothetical protein
MSERRDLESYRTFVVRGPSGFLWGSTRSNSPEEARSRMCRALHTEWADLEDAGFRVETEEERDGWPRT